MLADDALFAGTAEKLRETVRQGQSLETAQVKVIGLADIRAAAGDRWPQMAARVRATSMQFLQNHLRSDDLVIPAGDGFLVIYAEAEKRDLVAEAERLREALNTFYLGEEGTHSLRAHVERQTLDSRAVAALLGGTVKAPAPAEPPKPTFDMGFLPVWSIGQEAVIGYLAGPVRMVDGGWRLMRNTPWIQTGSHEDADQLALDLALLDRVIEAAKQSLRTGRRCLIGYSVHSSTMQHRDRRDAFIARAQTIPELVRPYITGQIAEIEPGAPAIKLTEWVQRLRPITARINLELHATEHALRGFDSTGAHGVSCAIPVARTREDIALAKRLIEIWTPTLRRQGLKYRLDRVVSPKLLTMAIQAGVDMVSCERYWRIAEEPAGTTALTREQVLNAIGPPPPAPVIAAQALEAMRPTA